MTGFSQREAQWSGASFQDREKEREGFEVVKKLRELVRYHITYKGVESGKFKEQGGGCLLYGFGSRNATLNKFLI